MATTCILTIRVKIYEDSTFLALHRCFQQTFSFFIFRIHTLGMEMSENLSLYLIILKKKTVRAWSYVSVLFNYILCIL